MTNHRDRNRQNTWNTQQFLSLSKNLEQAYGFQSVNERAKEDFWTTDKLISMSRHLSSAYGVDY